MNDNNHGPENPREPSDEEVAAVFRRLRELKAACRAHANSTELAIIMTKAIISEGWDTGPRIVGTLKRLGFNGKHAGATLAKEQGDNPERHHWRRDENGHYVVHDEEPPEPTSII